MQGRPGTSLSTAEALGPAPTPPSPDGSARARRSALTLLLSVTAVGWLADQATKVWALDALADGQRRPLLGDLLGLRLIHNPGAAFSFGTGRTWVFTLVALVVVVAVATVARRLTSRAWAITLGLLLAGALGNLTDRLLRPPGFARGHVIDFIAYADWFIGNVADIWVVLAAVGLVLLSLRGTPASAPQFARGTATDTVTEEDETRG